MFRKVLAHFPEFLGQGAGRAPPPTHFKAAPGVGEGLSEELGGEEPLHAPCRAGGLSHCPGGLYFASNSGFPLLSNSF